MRRGRLEREHHSTPPVTEHLSWMLQTAAPPSLAQRRATWRRHAIVGHGSRSAPRSGRGRDSERNGLQEETEIELQLTRGQSPIPTPTV